MGKLKGRFAFHRDVGKLEENCLKFTKDKHKFLHLGWNKSTHQSRLERSWWAAS